MIRGRRHPDRIGFCQRDRQPRGIVSVAAPLGRDALLSVHEKASRTRRFTAFADEFRMEYIFDTTAQAIDGIRTGIGGWTFAPWRDNFYPKGLVQRRELEYASRRLSTIEINGTYYGTQKPATYAKWRDETPDGFVFSA